MQHCMIMLLFFQLVKVWCLQSQALRLCPKQFCMHVRGEVQLIRAAREWKLCNRWLKCRLPTCCALSMASTSFHSGPHRAGSATFWPTSTLRSLSWPAPCLSSLPFAFPFPSLMALEVSSPVSTTGSYCACNPLVPHFTCLDSPPDLSMCSCVSFLFMDVCSY